jgi:hypothetical protein
VTPGWIAAMMAAGPRTNVKERSMSLTLALVAHDQKKADMAD